MKQISIIIPTYNMEKYIGKCIDSLLIPEIDEIEVWVVNDGSKDRSSEIAHEYAAKYPQSINVIDKENGNYGSCINAALPKCTGRYVKVLDADDTFDTEAFSKMVSFLPSLSEDVIVTDVVIVDENENRKEQPSFQTRGYKALRTYSFEAAFGYLTTGLMMHGVAYKLKNLIDMGYRQTERISYTDNEWIFAPICISSTFAFVPCGYLYKYLVGRQGQTMTRDFFFNHFEDHLRGLVAQSFFYENSSANALQVQFMQKKLCARMRMVYRYILEIGDKDLVKKLITFDKELRNNYPRVYAFSDSITYNSRNPYKLIRAFRKSGYSEKFRISPSAYIFQNLINMAFSLKNLLK